LKKIIQILFFLIPVITYCQEAGETTTIIGDSLRGMLVNGENIREVTGHVILTQGNIKITCNRAIQFLAKNDAILEGDVVVTQDSLTINAEKGYYYGNERIARCTTGVKLNDKKIILTAIKGDYYFNENRAYFSENVRLYDTVTTLASDKLTYFKKEEKAIAVGNVSIKDSINTIQADSIVHFRNEKITFAENNVKVIDAKNNTIIYGSHLEDYSKKKYTLITEFPLLVKIDTLEGGGKDSLLISSRIMESFNDSSKKFIASDSVRIVQGEFASRNNYTILFKEKNKIITMKRKTEENFPVLWYELTQLSGDSIQIFLKDNRLDTIKVFKNGLILSQNINLLNRYDQISGDIITIYFDSLGINTTDVDGNVLSIYYTYEDESPNGLTKSSAQKAKIIFKNKKADEVKLYGTPVSDYYPENMVEGNELTYTLPSFLIFKDRSTKYELLKNTNYTVPFDSIMEKANFK
jgi:lipopolysaccharide export system protein LptA